jgi:hypothetical protein
MFCFLPPAPVLQVYSLTRYLLTTYNNSGRTFFLGNWEGDWWVGECWGEGQGSSAPA